MKVLEGEALADPGPFLQSSNPKNEGGSLSAGFVCSKGHQPLQPWSVAAPQPVKKVGVPDNPSGCGEACLLHTHPGSTPPAPRTWGTPDQPLQAVV